MLLIHLKIIIVFIHSFEVVTRWDDLRIFENWLCLSFDVSVWFRSANAYAAALYFEEVDSHDFFRDILTPNIKVHIL